MLLFETITNTKGSAVLVSRVLLGRVHNNAFSKHSVFKLLPQYSVFHRCSISCLPLLEYHSIKRESPVPNDTPTLLSAIVKNNSSAGYWMMYTSSFSNVSVFAVAPFWKLFSKRSVFRKLHFQMSTFSNVSVFHRITVDVRRRSN